MQSHSSPTEPANLYGVIQAIAAIFLFHSTPQRWRWIGAASVSLCRFMPTPVIEIRALSFVCASMSPYRCTNVFGTVIAIARRMYESSTINGSPGHSNYSYDYDRVVSHLAGSTPVSGIAQGVFHGLVRRLRRERRRRKIGRAYDMALEIARSIPRGSEVLDVGCGNGYIAHHLSGLLGSSVLGVDLDRKPEAVINYRAFNGTTLPVPNASFDAVLLCYVLHHAQDVKALIGEIKRALRERGQVLVYEDIPERWWDALVCKIHDRKWRNRTGPCTFRKDSTWRTFFTEAGFEVVKEKPLSRWRNISHPVCRRMFLLRAA